MSAVEQPTGHTPEHELRRNARVRTLFAGRIVFHDGVYSCDCIVRELSEGGARVEIPASRLIPRRFYFLSSKEDVAYDCELIWRTRMMAGFRFRESIRLASCQDPKLRYLRQIAAELCSRR